MEYGSKPSDGGHLILNPHERADLLNSHQEAAPFVKRFAGAAEFINDIERYCLWIVDDDLPEARSIPPIAQRLDAVSRWRSESIADSTADFAAYPNRFKQMAFKPTDAIIIPGHSSERRPYIPVGYLGPDTVISNAAFAIYYAEPWVFTLLTSAMHMTWTRAVGGRMKTDYRYGAAIVYNNFPVPPLTDVTKERLTIAALRVFDVREYHCEKTLGELYDPDIMPDDLRAAHAGVDELVDSIYSKRGYETDEQRLSDLFVMYEAMITEEQLNISAKKKTGRSKK